MQQSQSSVWKRGEKEKKKVRAILCTYLATVLTIFLGTTIRLTIASTFNLHTPMTRRRMNDFNEKKIPRPTTLTEGNISSFFYMSNVEMMKTWVVFNRRQYPIINMTWLLHFIDDIIDLNVRIEIVQRLNGFYQIFIRL